MNNQRTDIHRPAEFNPADYRVIDYIDNKRPKPPVTGDKRALELYDRYIREVWEPSIFRHFPAYRANEGGDHNSIFTCNHCGHPHIRYVAVVEHVPTGNKLAFGEICAERTELPGRDAFRAKFVKDAAQKALARYEREQAELAFRTANEEVVAWLDTLSSDYDADTHPFLLDMKRALAKKGELTEKQIAATAKFHAAAKKRDDARAAEREALADTPALPEGKRQIEGEIVSAKFQHGQYGTQAKMLIREADGNKVWGTIPEALFTGDLTIDSFRGRHVKLTATVERSRDDEHYGFYKRPTGAVLRTEAASVASEPEERLEELRQSIRAEDISYGEIAELEDLAEHIAPGDVELLEWAGVPEFPEEPGTLAALAAEIKKR